MRLAEPNTIMYAGDCARERNASRKIAPLSSKKHWRPGDQALMIYPVAKRADNGEWDIITAQLPGHDIDGNGLGCRIYFAPSEATFGEYGEVLVPDRLYQFSKIAPLFVMAQKEREKKDLLERAGDDLPPALLQKSLQDIEFKYDRKNNQKAVKPVVSALKKYMTTELLFVPVRDDKPIFEDAVIVTQAISNSRYEKLKDIMKSKDYGPYQLDEASNLGYLETSFSFISTSGDASEAGRNAPQRVAPSMRAAVRYPECTEKLHHFLKSLAPDTYTMQRHSYMFEDIAVATLNNALTAYSALNSAVLTHLDDEGQERLVRNAAVVRQLQLRLPLELDSKIIEALGPDYHPESLSRESNIPEMDDLTIQSLLNANSAELETNSFMEE